MKVTPAGSVGEVDRLLAEALRGPAPWRQGLDPELAVRRAVYHGIAGCLVGRTAGWPEEATAALRRIARAQAMWDMRHRLLLADLLGRLDSAGIRSLVLKGSALAYDLYANPSERSRGDTDLWIAAADLDAAREALGAAGLRRRGDAEDGEDHGLQETWSLPSVEGHGHDIDLHWQALNAPSLMGLLPFEMAWARSVALPRLTASARRLPRDLALVLACVHRAKHAHSRYHVGGESHFGGDRLVWILDIDLLARALGPPEWEAVVTTSLDGGIAAAVLDGLRAASDRLGTPLPEGVERRLAAAERHGAGDRYLLARSRSRRMWQDLLATRGFGRRAAYLRATLLPPADRIRAKYPDRPGSPLPVLYLLRVAQFLRDQMGDRAGP